MKQKAKIRIVIKKIELFDRHAEQIGTVDVSDHAYSDLIDEAEFNGVPVESLIAAKIKGCLNKKDVVIKIKTNGADTDRLIG